ncbi:MAG: NifB/NifX family molybdenum-iron cluster-binding protein [Bacteroidota bacterium]
MKIGFAFAVSHDNQFEARHFGDADRYMIYHLVDGKVTLSSEELNRFKTMDEEQEHGSRKKGNAIIEHLKSKQVKVLVSKQFGKNIRMVNQHFVPVKISSESPEEVISILNENLHWIQDELDNSSDGYKLFTINSGILKTPIARQQSRNEESI